jgi:hypothetical protein
VETLLVSFPIEPPPPAAPESVPPPTADLPARDD